MQLGMLKILTWYLEKHNCSNLSITQI